MSLAWMAQRDSEKYEARRWDSVRHQDGEEVYARWRTEETVAKEERAGDIRVSHPQRATTRPYREQGEGY